LKKIIFSLFFILTFSTVSNAQIKDYFKEARTKGSESAPVQIIEYMDYQCPSCAKGAKYLEKIFEDYPNLVRLEMRFFPLNGRKHSLISAHYAQCAARQGKFWDFHHSLVDKQKQWSHLVDARYFFDIIAKELKVNNSDFDQCLEDKMIYDFLLDMKLKGKIKEVKSTPTYFINGKMIVGYKKLIEELNEFIPESEISETKQLEPEK